MTFKPPKALGLIVGLVVLATILGIQGFLLASISRQAVSLGLYVTGLLLILSLPLLGLWLYWYYELLSLRYQLDRNALVIDYGTARHIVPMDSVTEVVTGDSLQGAMTFRGVGWPGYLKGRQRVAGLGWLLLHSTEPLERTLIVVTDTMSYGISPSAPEAFLDAFRTRRELGTLHTVEQTYERSSLLTLPLWRDRLFWGIVLLGFLVNAAILAVVAARYGELGARIPLHLDASGQPDRIAAKLWLLVLPGIGLAMLGLNALLGMLAHLRERLAAHLLAAIGLATQVVLYLALSGILAR